MSLFTFNNTEGSNATPTLATAGSGATSDEGVVLGGSLDLLQFPDDLFRTTTIDGTDRITYAMLFFINKPQRGDAKIDTEVFSADETKSFNSAAGLDYWNEANATTVGQAVGTTAGVSANSTGRIRLPRMTRTVKKAIALYMTDTLAQDLSAQYTSAALMARSGLASIGGSISDVLKTVMGKSDMSGMQAAGSAAQPILDKVAGTNNTDLILGGAGLAVNEQQEVLFQSLDFRNFSFDFKMTPKSKYETDRVREIIRTFRQYMVPEFIKGSSGKLLVTPAFFTIAYLRVEAGSGDYNPYINKVSACVLRNVMTDYAPDGGWAPHADGSPVSIRLTLQFQEIELIHKARVDAGY